jgi:hypothetical protein
MLKFRTGGKTYTAASLNRPSIRDYINLAKATEELGRRFTSGQVFDLEKEIEGCGSAKERTDHPDFLFFLALIVWATLVEAGESDPFNKAIDKRLDDLDFFYEPAPEPLVAADPHLPRAARASARGARRPAAAKAPRARTSRTRSTPGS